MKIEKILAIPKGKRTREQEKFIEKEAEEFLEVAKAVVHLYERVNGLPLTKF